MFFSNQVMHLQENTVFDPVSHETPHHEPYAPAKYEVATFNGLGEEKLYLTFIVQTKRFSVRSTPFDLCTCTL